MSDEKDYIEDELLDIHDRITDAYIANGFDKNGEPTTQAVIYESIIDLFYNEFDI